MGFQHSTSGKVSCCPGLAQSGEARDLFRSNPALVWLAAVRAYDGALRPEEILNLCREKQVDILRRLLWPASKASLRLLRKTRLKNGDLGEARALRHVLMNAALLDATAHEREISLALLMILVRHPSLVQRHIVRLLNQRLGHRPLTGNGPSPGRNASSACSPSTSRSAGAAAGGCV